MIVSDTINCFPVTINEFEAEDICRSGLVREYIVAKLELGL